MSDKIPEDAPSEDSPASPTRVLISYSHDSTEHIERVLRLSNKLRSQGIDCRIDQYEPVPDQGWPVWMEQQIEKADFVLCVCTEEYEKRFDFETKPGVGKGVAWEANLVRNSLYSMPGANKKFLTVQFDKYTSAAIPACLQQYTNFTLSNFEIDGGEYEKLYRHLTGQQSTPAIKLGKQVKLLENRGSNSDDFTTMGTGNGGNKRLKVIVPIVLFVAAVVFLMVANWIVNWPREIEGLVTIDGKPAESGRVVEQESQLEAALKSGGKFTLSGVSRKMSELTLDIKIDSPFQFKETGYTADIHNNAVNVELKRPRRLDIHKDVVQASADAACKDAVSSTKTEFEALKNLLITTTENRLFEFDSTVESKDNYLMLINDHVQAKGCETDYLVRVTFRGDFQSGAIRNGDRVSITGRISEIELKGSTTIAVVVSDCSVQTLGNN